MTRSATRFRGSRRDLIGLSIGAALLFTAALGSRDLWNPNEPLYGRAVAEMAERGDWLVPTVNGEVFAEKPILYFWLARAAALIFGGVDELSLRLPCAAAGWIGVLLVYLLVLPYTSRARARIAGALFATIYAIFSLSRTAQMDLLLCVCCLAAITAAVRVLDHGWNPVRGWSLAGLATGLAVLAKGPVGLICPALVLSVYLLVGRPRIRPWPGGVWIGGSVAVLVAAPWFVLLWWTGQSEMLVEVVYRQNFTRVLDPWDHQSPWWYFLANFWIDMAPWSVFVPLTFALRGRSAGERSLDRLAWVWIAVIVIFFSSSPSKRSVYILPVAPAVAVLVSGLAERLGTGELESWRKRSLSVLLGVWGVLMLAAGVYLYSVAPDELSDIELPARATAVLAAAAGAAILSGLTASRTPRRVASSALFAYVLCAYLMAAVWVLPAADTYKSARPFCDLVAKRVSDGQTLRSYRMWKWRSSYVYYLDRRIDRIESAQGLREYWDRPERVFLIVEKGRLQEIIGILGPIEPLVERPIGNNRAYLFANR